MKIAVASGKGGTGKTTISTALALSLAEQIPVNLLDCDVEEPNAHIFIKGEATEKEATVATFLFDNDKCTKCGKCAKVCRFNALACLPSGPMFFPEMCHGCGGCLLACPAGAISEGKRQNGAMHKVSAGNLQLIYGVLNVGEAMASPLIRSVKQEVSQSDILCIIDSPPGASCSMLSAVSECDYVIMVTEPTPFGLHDLKLAVEALKELGLRYGIVVNRAEDGVNLVRDYCQGAGIDLLLEIPQSRKVAEGYSHGLPLTESYPESKEMLREMFDKIRQETGNNE